MKSIKAILLVLLMGLMAQAGEFDTGAPENDQRPLPNRSDADIQKQIRKEMAVACHGNLCQIVGTDNQGSSWTVAFSVGYGSNPNTGTGNTIYVGDQNNSNENRGYAGITVTYKNYTCHSTLRVTPAVYQFVNTYMYNMINNDYSTKRNFSPAEQTVVLFYTTMLNKVESCKASNL